MVKIMANDPYEQNYAFRYNEPWLQQRSEVSVVKVAQYIAQSDSDANRLAWANYAIKNSSVAAVPFFWSVALDPTVNEKGQKITGAEIDAVVSAALPGVIADFVKNPPPGITF